MKPDSLFAKEIADVDRTAEQTIALMRAVSTQVRTEFEALFNDFERDPSAANCRLLALRINKRVLDLDLFADYVVAMETTFAQIRKTVAEHDPTARISGATGAP